MTDDFSKRAAEYADKEWNDYQEHLKIGGKQLHVRSFIKLGIEWATRELVSNDITMSDAMVPYEDAMNARREVTRLKAENEKLRSQAGLAQECLRLRKALESMVKSAEWVIESSPGADTGILASSVEFAKTALDL